MTFVGIAKDGATESSHVPHVEMPKRIASTKSCLLNGESSSSTRYIIRSSR